MTRLSKLGVVLAGYVAAFLVASVAFYVLTRFRVQPDASGGMQAFGDSLLFIGLFAVLALVPSALAFYFLRPFPNFWTALSVASMALAVTGPVAAAMVGRTQKSPGAELLFGFFGLLRILGAPVLGFGFLISAVIAPRGRSRWVLVSAAVIEVAVSAYAFYCLLVLGHWPK
jgi:hypothetical protein